MVPRLFTWSSLGAFVLVSVALLAATVESGPVDCRRFVFAPACRGATIKRSRPSVAEVAEAMPIRDLRLNDAAIEAFEQYSQQADAEEATLFDQQRPLKLASGHHWPPSSSNRHRQLSAPQLESDD